MLGVFFFLLTFLGLENKTFYLYYATHLLHRFETIATNAQPWQAKKRITVALSVRSVCHPRSCDCVTKKQCLPSSQTKDSSQKVSTILGALLGQGCGEEGEVAGMWLER